MNNNTKYWIMTIIILIIFILVIFPKLFKEKTSLEDEKKQYLSCEFSNEFLTFLGYNEQDDCKKLSLLVYKENYSKCLNKYQGNEFSKQQNKELIDQCISTFLSNEFNQINFKITEFKNEHPNTRPYDFKEKEMTSER